MGPKLALVIPMIVRGGPRGATRASIPHLGVGYIAGNLPDSLAECRVFDCQADGLSEDALLQRLFEFDPDVVGFTAYTQSIKMVSRISAALKSRKPDTLTVVGGTHVSALPVETLESFPALDAAVAFEGERAFSELLEAFREGGPGTDLARIPGVCARHDGTVRIGPKRPPIEDLDSVSFPAWHLLDLDRYSGVYHMLDRARRAVPLTTGRGCSFHCSFCFRVSGPTQRLRSIPNVMEELRHNINESGVREVVILNESFLADHEHALSFCDAVIREGLHRRFRWSCQSRVDQVSPQILKMIRLAGCRSISMGIESGDPAVLDRIRKRATLEQGIEAVRMAREAGLRTDTNFILGLPGDTRESISRTIDHALRVDADMAGFARLTPFPGTDIAGMARRGEGGLRILSTDFDDCDKHAGTAMDLVNVPHEELDRLQRSAYFRFYRRPKRWLSALRMASLSVLARTLLLVVASGLRSLFHRRLFGSRSGTLRRLPSPGAVHPSRVVPSGTGHVRARH